MDLITILSLISVLTTIGFWLCILYSFTTFGSGKFIPNFILRFQEWYRHKLPYITKKVRKRRLIIMGVFILAALISTVTGILLEYNEIFHKLSDIGFNLGYFALYYQYYIVETSMRKNEILIQTAATDWDHIYNSNGDRKSVV